MGLFDSLPPASSDGTAAKKRAAEEDSQAGNGCNKRPREEAGASGGGGSGSEGAGAAGPSGASGGVLVTPLAAAYSEDKGSRKEMEDVAVIKLDCRDQQGGGGARVSFFGIFDGHGGRQVAELVAQQLHSSVMAAGLAAEAGKSGGDGVSLKACRAAITAGFKQLDEAVLKRCVAEGWADGCTAVVVWVVGEAVLVANVGDARCVLARRPPPPAADGAIAAGGGAAPSAAGSGAGVGEGGSEAPPAGQSRQEAAAANAQQADALGAAEGGHQAQQGQHAQQGQQAGGKQLKAVTLTREHKAIFPQERQRIERAGGFVSADGRLAGRIEVSRGFGDRAFKKQGMSAVPDIQAFTLSSREAFLLCGCDGFWGVFGPQDAVDFAAAELGKGYDVKKTCNRLVYEAIRERHCKDNCTVLLVQLGA